MRGDGCALCASSEYKYGPLDDHAPTEVRRTTTSWVACAPCPADIGRSDIVQELARACSVSIAARSTTPRVFGVVRSRSSRASFSPIRSTVRTRQKCSGPLLYGDHGEPLAQLIQVAGAAPVRPPPLLGPPRAPFVVVDESLRGLEER